MKIFELNNVSFSYNSVPALKDVGLVIEDGESIALLGANGSGKSTLLLILAGILFPEKGYVRFMENPFSKEALKSKEFVRELRKKAGVMLQNPDAMLFCDTVRDEIAFGPLQFGWEPERIEQKVMEIAELFNLTTILERESLSLSFGEKKRLAFATVLATEPEILLLDEPLSGLDPKSQAWLVELLIRLKEKGKTLIVATHDLESVEDYADRAIVLGEEHTILRDGPAHEILDDVPLLLRANLIHEHAHRHGRYAHIHPHAFRHEHKD